MEEDEWITCPKCQDEQAYPLYYEGQIACYFCEGCRIAFNPQLQVLGLMKPFLIRSSYNFSSFSSSMLNKKGALV